MTGCPRSSLRVGDDNLLEVPPRALRLALCLGQEQFDGAGRLG